MIDREKGERIYTEVVRYAQAQIGTDVTGTIEREAPDAETFAWVMLRASTQVGGGRWTNLRPGLDAQLQLLLTQEHVAAQKQMSDAAGKLQESALQLSRATYIVGGVSLSVAVAALVIAGFG
jgi:hypothetical protein